MIVTLLEMCLASDNYGLNINLIKARLLDKVLSVLKIMVLLFMQKKRLKSFSNNNIKFEKIGTVNKSNSITISNLNEKYRFDIDYYRKKWFEKSYMLDSIQSSETKALERYNSLSKNKLEFKFPKWFNGDFKPSFDKRVKAGVIRKRK